MKVQLLLAAAPLVVGDVRAFVNPRGETVIVGGAGSDCIILDGSPGCGELLVAGFNGTTVNGMEYVCLLADTDRVRIDLREGDDWVDCTDVISASMFLGPGDDRVGCGNSGWRLQSIIDCGPGDDVFTTEDCFALAPLTISGGEGADIIRHFSLTMPRTALLIDTTDGPDDVLFEDVSAAFVQVLLGAGNDVLQIENLDVPIGLRFPWLVSQGPGMFPGRVFLNGGPDVDEYIDLGDNSFLAEIKGFESGP